MADEPQTEAPVVREKAAPIYATLARGTTYYLGTKRFEYGVPQIVTAEEREHLEEHAVNAVTSEDHETEYKQKFRFGGPDDVTSEGHAATRARPNQRRRPSDD